MNPSKLQFLAQEALLLSKKSPMTFQHGAVIVHKGKIVSSGFNTPTAIDSPNRANHAELSAVENLRRTYYCPQGGKDRQ